MLKIPFPIPSYEILYTTVAPALDGWIESLCWKGANWIDRFISVESDKPTAKPTRAAMLWDAHNLYIAFQCVEEQTALLKADGDSPPDIWNDDCVEIYLNAGIRGIETFALAVNPAGKVGPAHRVIDDPGWGTFKFLPAEHIKASSRITSAGWQVEIAIPFGCFKLPRPKPSSVWRGNLCRNDKLGFQWSYWALGRTPGYVYSDSQLFPCLRFSSRKVATASHEMAKKTLPSVWPSKPRFAIRGIMYDTSRGAIVLGTEYWKKMLPLLAAQGCNAILMYFENHLRYTSHPEFAPKGSWTLSELADLQQAAAKYGIDVIPSQTSLGHCPGILRHPKFAHMAEKGSNGYQFCVSHPETGVFLGDILSELCRNSSSTFVNINADESGYLGLCQRCRKAFRGWSPGKIYHQHIMMLYEIARSHGKRMMMWDDMLWTFPDALEGLPRDIVLLDWHYTLHRRYPSVDVWRNMGFDVIVCPGMYMVENALWFGDYGSVRGAMGLINTLWESHYLPFGYYWPHLMATSWATHAPAPPDSLLEQWYEMAACRLFGENAVRLGRAIAGKSKMVRRGHKPPAISSVDIAAAKQVSEETQKLLARFNKNGPEYDLLLEFAYSSRLLLLHIESRWRKATNRLTAAYRKQASKELSLLEKEGLAMWKERTSCSSQLPSFFEQHKAIRRILSRAG